jgi:hypothetical protein
VPSKWSPKLQGEFIASGAVAAAMWIYVCQGTVVIRVAKVLFIPTWQFIDASADISATGISLSSVILLFYKMFLFSGHFLPTNPQLSIYKRLRKENKLRRVL